MIGIPRCLYKTPTPEKDVSEVYYLFIDEIAPTGGERWIVRERHGWFDDASKKFSWGVHTLNPDEVHGVSRPDAERILDMMVTRSKSFGATVTKKNGVGIVTPTP